MTSARLFDFLDAAPGAAWLIRRACEALLPGEDDPDAIRFLSWLKAECERYAEERGHLA